MSEIVLQLAITPDAMREVLDVYDLTVKQWREDKHRFVAANIARAAVRGAVQAVYEAMYTGLSVETHTKDALDEVGTYAAYDACVDVLRWMVKHDRTSITLSELVKLADERAWCEDFDYMMEYVFPDFEYERVCGCEECDD